MSLFDSHAHLNFEQFSEKEWPEVLQRAYNEGVRAVVDIATGASSLERSLFLPKSPVCLYRAAATPPHDLTTDEDPFFEHVQKAAEEGILVAIGETGLDYFHGPHTKKEQKAIFARYIALAQKTNLPLIIHCREAFEDLISILTEQKVFSENVLHCFTGTREDAKRLLEMGWSISFSGMITYPKSDTLREVVQYVPLDRLLIETDAPYLAPQAKRGKRNEPSFLHYTVETIAKCKSLSLEKTAQETYANAYRIFAP